MNPNDKPWTFNRSRTRIVVRDAAGDGPLFIIEGGSNPKAVAMLEKAINGDDARVERMSEALHWIAQYEGKGPPTTPWQDIVRLCGGRARDALTPDTVSNVQCPICHDTGRYPVGRSGTEADGNAVEFADCDCEPFKCCGAADPPCATFAASCKNPKNYPAGSAPVGARHDLLERAERMRQHILTKVVGRLCEPGTGRVAGWGCGLCGGSGKGQLDGTRDLECIAHEPDCMCLPLGAPPKMEIHPDTARLDWLDRVNREANARNGTVYGWRFDLNHNRAEVRLSDSNIPALPVREALDAAMAVSPSEGRQP